MATPTRRARVYFDPTIHRALRPKAVETSRSLSEIVNDVAREARAEDAKDLGAFEEPTAEPPVTCEEMLTSTPA